MGFAETTTSLLFLDSTGTDIKTLSRSGNTTSVAPGLSPGSCGFAVLGSAAFVARRWRVLLVSVCVWAEAPRLAETMIIAATSTTRTLFTVFTVLIEPSKKMQTDQLALLSLIDHDRRELFLSFQTRLARQALSSGS